MRGRWCHEDGSEDAPAGTREQTVVPHPIVFPPAARLVLTQFPRYCLSVLRGQRYLIGRGIKTNNKAHESRLRNHGNLRSFVRSKLNYLPL